jgi:hypothetical protein
MHRFAPQGSLHGLCGSIGEGKKPTHVITTIDASDQMVTGPKEINCRLDSNKPKKLIKDG